MWHILHFQLYRRIKIHLWWLSVKLKALWRILQFSIGSVILIQFYYLGSLRNIIVSVKAFLFCCAALGSEIKKTTENWTPARNKVTLLTTCWWRACLEDEKRLINTSRGNVVMCVCVCVLWWKTFKRKKSNGSLNTAISHGRSIIKGHEEASDWSACLSRAHPRIAWIGAQSGGFALDKLHFFQSRPSSNSALREVPVSSRSLIAFLRSPWKNHNDYPLVFFFFIFGASSFVLVFYFSVCVCTCVCLLVPHSSD